MVLSLTLIVIIASVAASFYAWQNTNIYNQWMMNPVAIDRKKEYWRFVTSGFIHADGMHLFFNMFALYSFGEYLEFYFFKDMFGQQTGGLYFVILYFGGVVLSDIPSFFKHRTDSRYNSVGASGGVSAVIFAAILLNPMQKILFYFIPLPGIIFAFLYVLYSVQMAKRGYDNVNHSAHLYGALFGVVFVILVYPAAVSNFSQQLLRFVF
jgi:membrane associated rhomboid family serine protease